MPAELNQLTPEVRILGDPDHTRHAIPRRTKPVHFEPLDGRQLHCAHGLAQLAGDDAAEGQPSERGRGLLQQLQGPGLAH